jgi:putative hydrolase of the HAD superfamily
MERLPPPRAILLDLDDTLYAERTYFESGLAAVADFVAGDAPDERCAWRRRLFADVRDNGRSGALDRIPPPEGQSRDGWRAALLHVYRTHAPELTAFADVDAFFARARLNDRRLGLVTDGKSCVQWRKLQALGLEARLDAVVCSDDIDTAKPALEPFLAAAARLGVAPRSCIYIADDPSKDFIAPAQLGMGTIEVRRDLPHPLAKTAPDPRAEAACRVASLTAAADFIFGGSS